MTQKVWLDEWLPMISEKINAEFGYEVRDESQGAPDPEHTLFCDFSTQTRVFLWFANGLRVRAHTVDLTSVSLSASDHELAQLVLDEIRKWLAAR